MQRFSYRLKKKERKKNMNKEEVPGGTGGRPWDVNKIEMYTYMEFSQTN